MQRKHITTINPSIKMATLGLLEESLVRLLGAGQVVIPLLVCVLITVASLMFLANRLRQAAVK